MAEIAGLALGGVAIAGLFSTCIEFIDYLESSKDCTRDVQISLTKLAFLKRRLNTCGELISVYPASDKFQHDYYEQSLIAKSLDGIRNILAAASLLCCKYKGGVPGPTPLRQLSRSQSTLPCNPKRFLAADSSPVQGSLQPGGRDTLLRCSYDQTSECHVGSKQDLGPYDMCHLGMDCEHQYKELRPPNPPTQLRRFRLKIIWALTDRKKLDSYIIDLDFLLSNLERLARTIQMSEPNEKRKRMKVEEDSEMTFDSNSIHNIEVKTEGYYQHPSMPEMPVSQGDWQAIPPNQQMPKPQNIARNIVSDDSHMMNSRSVGTKTRQPDIFDNTVKGGSIMCNAELPPEDITSIAMAWIHRPRSEGGMGKNNN